MRNPRTTSGAGAREFVDHHDDLLTIPPATDAPAALRRRRHASWRCPPLPDGRLDPWADRHFADCGPRELESWAAAIAYLRRLHLYSPGQVPRSVHRAGRRWVETGSGAGRAA
ncbi:MAG: hypothetical protein ACRDUW_19980 [Pseudonocardiaceae bacterium]